jgi:chemotaxis protein MotB
MRSMLVLAVLSALATDCVSQSKYNELAAEAQNLDTRLKDEKQTREALEAKVKQLEEQNAALERDKEALSSRLTTSESCLTAAERHALEQRNIQLTTLNDELAKSTRKLAEATGAFVYRARALAMAAALFGSRRGY